MIVGIGIDIARSSRLKSAKKRSKLLDRIFTDSEKKYCFSKADPWLHLAARFAAKEAFVKANEQLICPKDIEIRLDSRGHPRIQLKRKNRRPSELKKIKRSWLSLSHDGDYAIALVLLES